MMPLKKAYLLRCLVSGTFLTGMTESFSKL
jgi:hypothetical protein